MAAVKKLTGVAQVDTNIVVVTVCSQVRIAEDESVANWPTVGFSYKLPGGTQSVTKQAGKDMVFLAPLRCFFQPGDILCSIQALSSSTDFLQEEQ